MSNMDIPAELAKVIYSQVRNDDARKLAQIRILNKMVAAFGKVEPAMMDDSRAPLSWFKEELLECVDAIEMYEEYRDGTNCRKFLNMEANMICEMVDVFSTLSLCLKSDENLGAKFMEYAVQKWSRKDKRDPICLIGATVGDLLAEAEQFEGDILQEIDQKMIEKGLWAKQMYEQYERDVE